MAIAKYADISTRVRGGRIERIGARRWRVQGDYMYGGWIENIHSRELAEEILAALDDTADALRDLLLFVY